MRLLWFIFGVVVLWVASMYATTLPCEWKRRRTAKAAAARRKALREAEEARRLAAEYELPYIGHDGAPTWPAKSEPEPEPGPHVHDRRGPYGECWDCEIKESSRLRAEFLSRCRPALAADYSAWLSGYVRKGGRPSHRYDYSMPDRDWCVLEEKPSGVPSLYGALSLNVIVPDWLDFRPDDVPRTFGRGQCGHSTFYFMRDYAIVGDWVPTFTDVAAPLRA
jgi:hypothetical protein